MKPSATVAELREHFGSGLTRQVPWRRDQLESLRRMLRDNRELFEQALFDDLGKSEVESGITEIGFLLSEIKHTLKHLDAWVKPQRVSTPIALQPASARIVPEPLGVALIIAPWNYPLLLTLSPLVGALAAGNAAVLKPSELASATSTLLEQLVPVYLDPRAVRVVTGGVAETTELLEQRFDHIFYTGNGRVGRIVMTAAAKHLTPVTLELGGKSPLWIDETVNIRAAAKRIAWAKFVNTGQTCVAPDYVLGRPETLDALTEALADAIDDLYGFAIEKNPDYGRIINDAHFARLTGYLSDANVVLGGEFDKKTRFIAPTVIRNPSLDAPVMTEEIFGPILPLVEVDSLDDAIALVRERDKPLALYAFTDDAETRARWQAETSSGGLAFNAAVLQLSALDLPFGGVGESGVGAYHGKRSFDIFSHQKAVLSKPLSPDTLSATVMPPYSETKRKIVQTMLE